MSVNEIKSMLECQQVCTNMSNKIVVLDFTATWCGPCKRIYPVLQELSTQYPQVGFYKVDIDNLQDVATHFGIDSVPSFKFIYNNKIVAEFAGADSQRLKNTLAELTQNL